MLRSNICYNNNTIHNTCTDSVHDTPTEICTDNGTELPSHSEVIDKMSYIYTFLEIVSDEINNL